MKLVTTKLCCVFVFCLLSLPTLLLAQIPNTSPFPVDFIVNDLAGFQRQFDYVSTADFGTNLTQTVTGEIAWARDDGMFDSNGDGIFDGADSLNCNWGTTMANVAGKVALIRRGACNFSQKIYNAQTAGAIGVVIVTQEYGGHGTSGMALGDSVVNVVIPAVLISREDGDLILDRLDNGETVLATFQVKSFSEAIGPNAFKTPLSQVKPLSNISATALNIDTANAIIDAMAQVEIHEPSGSSTVLSTTIPEIPAAGSAVFPFSPYTPGEVGEYTMVYTTSISDDTLTRTFHITDNTFQIDYGNLPVWPEDSWIIESDQAFLDAGLRYDFGNMFYTGETGPIAAFATFSIANPDSLITGDPEADFFTLTLYDMDPDGDGVGPVGNEADYSEIGDINDMIVAQTTYVLDGTEIPYDIITVPFETPVTLKANGQYLLMAEYDGVNAALGNPPYYSYSGTDVFPGITSVTYTDQLHLEGFGDLDELLMEGTSSSFHAVVRLHLDGFTNTDDFKVLDAHKVTLMPNPTKDHVNIQFNLDNNADEVLINLISMDGQLVESRRLENVLNETYRFDVDRLAAGSYFFGILTPEGYKAQKFVVVK